MLEGAANPHKWPPIAPFGSAHGLGAGGRSTHHGPHYGVALRDAKGETVSKRSAGPSSLAVGFYVGMLLLFFVSAFHDEPALGCASLILLGTLGDIRVGKG